VILFVGTCALPACLPHRIPMHAFCSCQSLQRWHHNGQSAPPASNKYTTPRRPKCVPRCSLALIRHGVAAAPWWATTCSATARTHSLVSTTSTRQSAVCALGCQVSPPLRGRHVQRRLRQSFVCYWEAPASEKSRYNVGGPRFSGAALRAGVGCCTKAMPRSSSAFCFASVAACRE
jgi:hypothetical protein